MSQQMKWPTRRGHTAFANEPSATIVLNDSGETIIDLRPLAPSQDKPTDSQLDSQLETDIVSLKSAAARTQKAFAALVRPPKDPSARIAAQREYRDAAGSLLKLEREQNERETPGEPWDLAIVAEPLVQQTMIEADYVDAFGDHLEADRLRDWAIDVAHTHLDENSFAEVRRQRAILAACDGRFNEALAEMADVRSDFGRLGNATQSAQTALEEAVLLEWLGDNQRCLEAIDDAALLVEPTMQHGAPGPKDIMRALGTELQSILGGQGRTKTTEAVTSLWKVSVQLIEQRARTLKALGHYDEAAALFTQVLGSHNRGAGRSAVEYQLADIDALRGDFDAAAQRIKRIEPDFQSGLLRPKRARLRILQADVELGRNDAETALTYVEQGWSDLAAYPNDDLRWKLYWRQGRALSSLGKRAEALEAYLSAAQIVDVLRRAPLGYRLDSTSLVAKMPLFDEAIDISVELGDARASALLIELVKARSLSSVLSISQQQRSPRSEREVRFDDVTARLDALEYREYQGSAVTAALQQEREALQKERRLLAEQVRLRDPRWRGLTEAAPFSLDAVVRALQDRNQAAITLYQRDNRIVSVLIYDNQVDVASQELTDTTVDVLEQYAANLLRWKPDPYLLDNADLSADSFIPASFLQRAIRANSVLIAPHGRLHLLGWSALRYNETRLFEQSAVGIIPNLTCVTALDAEFHKAPRLALAGASSYNALPNLAELPHTATELTQLEQMYEDRLVAPCLRDAQATENAVHALLARKDSQGATLHLACHGTLSIEDPLGCGLLFVDGKLDAAELSTTKLYYDEVVLSACSTGWRPQATEGISLTGDDILGLPGALLEAGARSIVVSIPKASDEATVAFMTTYHRFRCGGMSPLVAFRYTQRTLQSDGTHEPYTWAGIVCYAVR
jgi:CHAT domain-containing protein